MISCSFFYNFLIKKGVSFFSGIPDSLLKHFCAYVADRVPSDNHIVAANEGAAVALATGHHLATGGIGLVYMQNSGQGNAMNPLISLADPDMHSIPLLLLIGWRGEPGRKDEPQHIKQGKITLPFLETINIPYRIIPKVDKELKSCLADVFDLLKTMSRPVALIVRRNTFQVYKSKEKKRNPFELAREDVVKLIVDNLMSSDIIVSTTGKTSRELYEYREQLCQSHDKDFLTVGSMGHCSQIALGIALSKKSKQVFCLDGDGAAIMHMGAFATIGLHKACNFKHIIINNGSHDSVGGQLTAGFSVSFVDIAKACGYKMCLKAEKKNEIVNKVKILRSTDGPALLEIKVRRGARFDLGRPKISPQENKTNFMEFLSK